MQRSFLRLPCSAVAVPLLTVAAFAAHASSLRFFGNGVDDIDRVKIPIDDPASLVAPGPPADVGAQDFTIELWLRTPSPAANPAPPISCGPNNNWILGNIVFDRDRYDQARAFGISLGDGLVAFGVRTSGDLTICGTTDLRDGAWHHVAVQRRLSDGWMWLYVDGTLQAQGDGPNGDLSYPDDGVPNSSCGPGRNQPCTNSDPFIVIGAEKHDAGSQYPSFNGWVDEVRLSSTLRYPGNFTPPQTAFSADAATAALYHFDEPAGTAINDSAGGGASPGELKFGGNPAGPVRDASTPFTTSAGAIELSASTYAAAETAASASFAVIRVGGSAGAATVDWATAAGTALPGADFSAASGTLRWSDGDAAPMAFNVVLHDDAESEGNETFGLALTNPTGAALGSRASATVTILDDDGGGATGAVRFAASTYAVGEGAPSIALSIERFAGSVGPVTVDYTTADGTAVAGADYTPASGTLRWSNGDSSSRTVQISILDDAAVETAETVTVVLRNATGGVTIGAPALADVTITDDDRAASGGGGGGGGGAAGLLALLALMALTWARRRAGRLFN